MHDKSLIEQVIYKWVLDNFGESEADDPSWSIVELAKEINNIPVRVDINHNNKPVEITLGEFLDID